MIKMSGYVFVRSADSYHTKTCIARTLCVKYANAERSVSVTLNFSVETFLGIEIMLASLVSGSNGRLAAWSVPGGVGIS